MIIRCYPDSYVAAQKYACRLFLGLRRSLLGGSCPSGGLVLDVVFGLFDTESAIKSRYFGAIFAYNPLKKEKISYLCDNDLQYY